MGISRRGKRARSEEVRIAEGDTKQDGAGKAQPLIPCAVPRIPPRLGGDWEREKEVRHQKMERSYRSRTGLSRSLPRWGVAYGAYSKNGGDGDAVELRRCRLSSAPSKLFFDQGLP